VEQRDLTHQPTVGLDRERDVDVVGRQRLPSSYCFSLSATVLGSRGRRR
jgi:hypothetical protein